MPPKCRLCGVAHWSWEPHKYPSVMPGRVDSFVTKLNNQTPEHLNNQIGKQLRGGKRTGAGRKRK